MTASSNSRIDRADLAAVVLAGLWLVLWRAVLATPWGLHADPVSQGLLNAGILYNPGDTWSYLSWVQQYHGGADLAGLLYTTESHSSLLWLFPLWLVGKVSAGTGLPVVATYNVAGLFGALATVFLFRQAARALRLTRPTCAWATLALVTGSGGSWLWHLAHKLHLAGPARGGDLYFFDLFPSTAFLAYAYHAMGLALLAGLWWTATEMENRLVAGTKTARWAGAAILFAGLLGFSRPYEPLAFLGAWLLKTVWHGLHRKTEPFAWKASALIACLLAATLAPGIGWTAWVSRQPVWSAFAHESLALGLPRVAWLWTLGGWGILAALGTRPAWRADRRLAILPLAATALLVFILIGLGSGYTKLASGLMFGPILLAGWGASRLCTATARLARPVQIAVMGVALSALLGLASFYMAVNTIRLKGPILLDAGMVALAEKLPQSPGAPPPVVLTDGDTGTMLPGLTGARVWVGHWSLSPHYQAKIDRLRAAGVDPAYPPPDAAAADVALDAVLADAHFDHALLDRRCRRAIDRLKQLGWKTVSATPRWVLMQPDAATTR